jgi:predicted esterase
MRTISVSRHVAGALLGLVVAMVITARLGAQAASPDTAFQAPLQLVSAGSVIRGGIFVAAGPGPHPTIVRLLGFPGSTSSVVSAALQQAGFNAVQLYVRGQLTSEGRYTVPGGVEDAMALIAFLRSDSARRTYRVDSDRILISGNSAGAFVALVIAAADDQIRCISLTVPFNWSVAADAARQSDSVRRFYEASLAAATSGTMPPVRVDSGFLGGLLAEADHFDARRPAAQLRGRTVVVIGALRDETAPLATHFNPIVEALRRGGALVQDTLLDDGHTLPTTGTQALATLTTRLRRSCYR